MELINNLQAEILEHLGRFGYLAVSQFRVLTGRSVGYIREMLGSLSRRGFIKSYVVTVTFKVRAENIYFLTQQGKEFLMNHKSVFADDLKLPTSSNPAVIKDYFHRYNCVSVNIEIYKYLKSREIPIMSFYTYFDKSERKGKLIAKTKIPLEGREFFIPDALFKTERSLLLVETFCDRDSKRILSALGVHAKAITLGTPGKSFDIPVNPLVLSVFEHASTKNLIINKLKANPYFEPMCELFFFASLEDIKQDFSKSFKTINNDPLMIT